MLSYRKRPRKINKKLEHSTYEPILNINTEFKYDDKNFVFSSDSNNSQDCKMYREYVTKHIKSGDYIPAPFPLFEGKEIIIHY